MPVPHLFHVETLAPQPGEPPVGREQRPPLRRDPGGELIDDDHHEHGRRGAARRSVAAGTARGPRAAHADGERDAEREAEPNPIHGWEASR
jgi:hypothetical protein